MRHAGPVTIAAIQDRYAFPTEWMTVELARLVGARQLAHGRFTPQAARSDQTTLPAEEFVELPALEQIHRRTLAILRREVRPVSFAVFADFLVRWQHLSPDERLAGEGALRQALQQLRAAPIAGQAWERDVLPLRLAYYRPAELEMLCQSGELVWLGSGGVDPRRGRVRFLFRGEGNAYVEAAPEDLSDLSATARAIHGLLKSEGAVFFADLRAGLNLGEGAVEAGLIELVMAGLVTNDSLGAMRQIIERGAANLPAGRQDQAPLSPLEVQLAERMGGRGRPMQVGHKPGHAQYRAAKRRVRQRLEAQHVPRWAGRWTLVHRPGIMGRELPTEERAAQQARQLLLRYGVVTRESLEREEGTWDWIPIYQQLQRMEMRGEVRRGYFVQGLPGVQFALPEAVERLRELGSCKQALEEGADVLTVMNACDPANQYGPLIDHQGLSQQQGELNSALGAPLMFARIPSTWLVQRRGLPVLVVEDTGARLTTIQGAGEGWLRRALQTALEHLAKFEYRVTVNMWDGIPVLDSPGRALLESLGFYRDYPGMTWDK